MTKLENNAERISQIKENALNPVGKNAVSFELTEQQALSIMLRNNQLKNESRAFVNLKKIKEQIELCYKQR